MLNYVTETAVVIGIWIAIGFLFRAILA